MTIICEFDMDLELNRRYQVALSPNGIQKISTLSKEPIKLYPRPILYEVYPLYLFRNYYEQNLTLRGQHLSSKSLRFEILSEKRIPIFDTDQYLELNDTHLMLQIPSNEF